MRKRLITMILAGGLMLPLPSSAQNRDDEEGGPFREPNIEYAATATPYLPWVIATLLIVGVILISFKDPRRSHLD